LRLHCVWFNLLKVLTSKNTNTTQGTSNDPKRGPSLSLIVKLQRPPSFHQPTLLSAKHISALCADISCINDMQCACTDIPSFHVSVGNICKPAGYTIDHSDWAMHSKSHISIVSHYMWPSHSPRQWPISHISVSFRTSTKLKLILGNVKPVTTTSWHTVPKSKLTSIPPFEYLRTMTTKIVVKARAGQIQLTGGPYNSVRSCLRATIVYTYVEGEGWGLLNSLLHRYFRTKSYAKSMVDWQETELDSIQRNTVLLCVV
jgi:hypothetical protein